MRICSKALEIDNSEFILKISTLSLIFEQAKEVDRKRDTRTQFQKYVERWINR